MAEIISPYVFKTIRNDIDAEFTVKRSRFIGSARVALSVGDAGNLLKDISAIYPKANHHCWAYRVGIDQPTEHCSDAGEPAGTAGRPILGMLKRHALDNTLLVVTRYFGGIKLGVRGLIDAYGETAELAITTAGTVEMELNNALEIACEYDYYKNLSSILHKWGISEERQKVIFDEGVKINLEVPCSLRDIILPKLQEMSARGFLKKLEWKDDLITRERSN